LTELVLLAVAAAWVVVLAPPMLRARRNGRPSDSIGSFNRHLSVLSRANPPDQRSRAPRPLAAGPRLRAAAPISLPSALASSPARLSSVQRRRRDVFVALCGLATISLLGAIALQGTFVWLAVLSCTALAGYVGMLLRLKRVAAERSYHRDSLVGSGSSSIGRLDGATPTTVHELDDDWDDDDWAAGPVARGAHDLDDWDDWDLVDAR
jgi:hypothetical protein